MKLITKTKYAVILNWPSGDTTIKCYFDNAEDAQTEARNRHQKDRKTYTVCKITEEEIYRISGD